MGMSSQLHGKLQPLPPGKVETCRNCLRQFDHYLMLVVEKEAQKACPYCRKLIPAANILKSK